MYAMKHKEQEGAVTASVRPGDPAAEQAEKRSVVEELDAAIEQAAKLAAHQGVELDVFMAAAYDAFLHASPELREHLERMQMLKELEQLRSRGLLGQA